MHFLAATAAVLAAAAPFESSIEPLPGPMVQRLKAGDYWSRGCPVPLSGLRLLTVSYRDFEGRSQAGQLVVNRSAAPRLRVAFRRLYALNFPIRHMRFDDAYGRGRQPSDVTASFYCRRAVPSPCNPGRRTGWSMHAYGLAIDINPFHNPYLRDGIVGPELAEAYTDRTWKRPGMIFEGDAVVDAFDAIGWGWGGRWNSLKDWMHFSLSGH